LRRDIALLLRIALLDEIMKRRSELRVERGVRDNILS
jgi:hypothetical protein